ncbi:CDP-glucose 4,6-dehydratase [Candidatus Magnetominusculus xianensis]|uniref:CDP-glucose 4,6-dehydratase n=1 Tax=Candidatus Magnetominusculus xianensis TaxID=1748249 RepID=A0ABR5SGN7_9BACT|nr:CDP-glucose 4,6-dehydratase [Candidatus Magnetominusculus xianensis]KWT82461.1 CDP-glucose 4,6-dehydratase [Candidatus Magnetominusculus xianensis]
MIKKNLFDGAYDGSRVLVTGHTGFKGSWLTLWLLGLGAKVAGFSSYLPSKPCNYEVLKLNNRINNFDGDIRDYNSLSSAFESFRPDIVFHLAAQPIVRLSHEDPLLTFSTNVQGTVNVMHCIKNSGSVRAAVVITSDKCYRNVEWPWGYRENDTLGGDDPYSASKACAEIVFKSYAASFFSGNDSTRIATARAGNVIGGGDWARDRIIPDCVRAWSQGREAVIRNPNATRPWQHVLEPLSGYLQLGARLLLSDIASGESFNFGPDARADHSVGELIGEFMAHWGVCLMRHEGSKIKESSLLKLCCDKALARLNWYAALDFKETVRLTALWYKAFYEGKDDMFEFSIRQIGHYIVEAQKKMLNWSI